jgi:ketosteroid isomerase-like protein
MSTRIGVTVVAAAALAFILLPAHAQAHNQARPPMVRPQHVHKRAEREQIELLEKDVQAAQAAGDVSAMDKMLSDDYLGTNANGEVVTKSQQLDHMQKRKFVISSLQTSDLKIKLIGQIAIVTCLAEITGVSDGAPIHGNFRYTRVYQRLPNDTWTITSFEATRSSRPAPPEPPVTIPSPSPSAR